LNRTTNGGDTWYFQIPDTSLRNVGGAVNFVNKLVGWVTSALGVGIHTTTGGNDTFYTSIKQISTNTPKAFKLFQNYPNPFNPKTIISYELKSATGGTSYVKLIVYNITGKEIVILVNEKQDAGSYEVDFSGNGLSSGVYFYQLIITNEKGGEVYRETKKAILIK
jgi:hypothetical protein